MAAGLRVSPARYAFTEDVTRIEMRRRGRLPRQELSDGGRVAWQAPADGSTVPINREQRMSAPAISAPSQAKHASRVVPAGAVAAAQPVAAATARYRPGVLVM